ncbi:MAG: mandelate racemase/muconate lactonizing enzyme family protein, partial [Chloroflexota bacterium]|nr:mandelate racemase/muconate lactonizing enzyme family protein [Chloroflexota bacterium]
MPGIERVETAYYRLPLKDVGDVGDAGHGVIDSEELITVQVAADGLVGHGYAYTIGRGGRAIKALIDHDLAPLLLGRGAEDVEQLWQLMWQHLLYVGRGGLASFAIAALDVALWDLRGLRAGQPLYAVLGARARELPAYGSGVDLPKPLPALLRQVEDFLERGFRGVKVKVGRPEAREDEARVAAVRRLIGDSVDLMVDANMAWSYAEARERGARLLPQRLLWLEEPCAPEDVVAHARLSAELAVAIAVGESLHAPAEFERYLAERAVGVVQIDAVTNGGITACLRALALADAAGLPTSSHY